MYTSDDEWDEFLLMNSNLRLKYMKRRQWMHYLWGSRTDQILNFLISSENITELTQLWIIFWIM
jgi:hypothetical protein